MVKLMNLHEFFNCDNEDDLVFDNTPNYESCIKAYTIPPKFEYDNQVMKAVMRLGIRVDKEELIKALRYDRDQYEKGYNDGKEAILKEIIHMFERNECGECPSKECLPCLARNLRSFNKWIKE